MKVLHRILPVLMLVPAALSMPAHAEAAVKSKAKTAKAAAAAAADTAAVNRLTFSSESTIEFNESYKMAETGYTLNFMAGDGWIINSNLNVGKKSYRGRDMDSILETFMNSAAKIDPERYMLNILFSNNYNIQKSLALSRYGKEIVFETQSAGINFKLTKPLLKASKSEFFVTSEASRGPQDFKFNTTVKTNVGGRVYYTLNDNVRMNAGLGTSLRREESSVEYVKFDWMTSHSDTLSARLVIGEKGDPGEKDTSKLVDITYKKELGTLRDVQPPFGNSMDIIDDPELAKEERNDNKGEVLTVESAAQITDRASVRVSFNRNYSDQRFMIEDRRNKEFESKNIDAGVAFRYHKQGNLGITLKRAETDTELGPTSIASYRTMDYSLSGSLTQTFPDSLRLSVSASTSLNQRYFKKKALNPRDADYLNSSLECRLDGRLFNKIRTAIIFETRRMETINIDASISGDNRVDFQYLLSPELSFEPVSWITLRQKYEINLDYTEFTFDTDRNYLDRNTTLETDASFRIMPPVKLGLNHKYKMKDTGSYLSEEGEEKLYGPTNENFEHQMILKCEYVPSLDVLVFVRTSYKTQTSNTLGMIDGKRRVVNTSGSDSGDLRMGFERSRKITDTGKLDLDVAYVKRYGPFISDDRKQYWEIFMNLKLDF